MSPAGNQEKTRAFGWTDALHRAKEKMVKVLWGLAGIAEGERELALKEVLWEMEELQKSFQDISLKQDGSLRMYREENELLRSLLGTNENELRARLLALAQDIHDARTDLIAAQDEGTALRKKAGDAAEANEGLRHDLEEARRKVEALEAERTQGWQSGMSGFADEQTALQQQMDQLNTHLKDVQGLLSTQTEEMTREKQAELAALQTRLLTEMEGALRQKEELLWAEEDLFARGVAQKLRGELQSARGRLQLALERFRLLEPEPGPAVKTWEQWWRLLKVGPGELRRDFHEVTRDLTQAVETLEEYLALTHRQAAPHEDVLLPERVRALAARRAKDRTETGALEVLVPDALPAVHGDGEFIDKILEALLDNAFEALPRSGGRVRVQAEKSPDGKEVWVSVSDSGAGVPLGQRDRLFQPFSSSKSGHRGLGLARSRRYAEWHHGRLELVESGSGGSQFRLALPLPERRST
ncbi:MAG: hypothetical protein HY548_07545 [Elusimicrobia bacterium]|nr:hypothetical protein [Elusimicrobiota bacterium]